MPGSQLSSRSPRCGVELPSVHYSAVLCVVYSSGMYCVVGLCVVGVVQGCWARGADRASNAGE